MCDQNNNIGFPNPDKIQEFYWRVILKVPESCPKMALRMENLDGKNLSPQKNKETAEAFSVLTGL